MIARSRGVLALLVAAVAPLAHAGVARAEEAPPCEAIEVEYALSANLQLSDTPMGQGDGIYAIGPGVAVVRFEQRGGVPAGAAKLVGYEMTERFRIDSRTLFWKTHVLNDSKTTVAHDACGVSASGALSGRTLTWTTDVKGARTDGTTTCDGSLCGSFGAPPAGTSPLHIAPHDTRFSPWVFGADMKTFTMPKTWMARSESPRFTSHLALAGREVRRTCAPRPKC